MTKLEALYDMAYTKGIHIHDWSLGSSKKAFAMRMPGTDTIALDRLRIESSYEESILVAEELGHYETDNLYHLVAGFNTPLARTNRIKGEAKARQWAIEHLLSLDEIHKALEHGCKDINEIAEFCQVTPEFLLHAVEYYCSTD